MSLSGKRVLVTGATGFIGGRLVERLILREGAQVTALVRDFAHASRLARFDLRMIPGDVRDLALLRSAAQDCDYVVHCAVSFAGSPAENRDVSVAGVEAVCRAAGEVGAAGLVHLSTFSVYGDTPPGPLVESSPKSPSDAYGKSKLEAEELVRVHQRQGLPAVILQPTIVYGPWSFWSTHSAAQLSRGRIVLPDLDGLCNAVYVDDVVEAILLALSKAAQSTGSYLISGAEPVEWSAFYEASSSRAQEDRSLHLPMAEIRNRLRAERGAKGLKKLVETLRFNPAARQLVTGLPLVGPSIRLAKRAFPGAMQRATTAPDRDDAASSAVPELLPHPDHLALLASKTRVCIDAARSGLGYRPAFDLSQGMQHTQAWLDWVANSSELSQEIDRS
jgi:nucleoside-diphosphate-sugar epimerase